MNHKATSSTNLRPRRALRADFTEYTLQHAAKAKNRADYRQRLAYIKELFSMRSNKFLRAVPSAAIAVAVVAITSTSTYAIANWFNANVTARQNDSVLSVDLSGCKGNLPPGINDNADRSNIKFQILGEPHFSADQLQGSLLAECELGAVMDAYRGAPGGGNLSYYSGTLHEINEDGTVKLDYFWAGNVNQKLFALAPDADIYNQGVKAGAQDLKVGDKVVFVVEQQTTPENVDPLSKVIQIKGVFKTQYDTSQAPSAAKNKSFYEDGNIRPL